MRPKGDIEFEASLSKDDLAPRWFVVVSGVAFEVLKVGILYAVAKLVSIEAALVFYAVVLGVLKGLDDYSESRNMKMFQWNDSHLNTRVTKLEDQAKESS
jgi:hypothetical protein